MHTTSPHVPEEMQPWSALRKQMSITEKWAYFDHAAVSPLPTPTRDTLVAWAQQAADDGDTVWPQWEAQVEQLRALAAGLLNAKPEEIALIRNTGEGLNFVAEGYPWQPGDNVVILADEFPANQYPWLNLADRGVQTRRIATDDGRVDLDRLAAACDDRTRVLSISWVGYASGWRNDLDRLVDIAHSAGAMLVVDGIQGLGVLPIDVQQTKIDFLAADGHKWMLGPEGAGVCFIRQEHLQRLRPVGVGWNSVVHAHDFGHLELVFRPTAARYEGGSRNMAGLLGLKSSMELLTQIGPEAISQRIFQITDLACQQLEAAGAVIHSDRSPQHKSGIVAFDLPGRDLPAIRRQCLEQGIVLSVRNDRLRISPHAYNDASDVQRLIAALQ